MRKLTIEEVQEKIIDYPEECKKFIDEVIESNCEFYKDGEIIIIKRMDNFKELRNDCIGLFITISYNIDEYWVYLAVEDSNGIKDWLNLGEYSFSESLASLTSKAIKEAGTCNLCDEYVGYKDIHQFSFAGKCCSKCLSKAKEKYGYGGWIN